MRSLAIPRNTPACREVDQRRSCRAAVQLRSLEDIIADYRRNYAPQAKDELDWYAALPVREAITFASRAERPDGKRHTHQRRISSRALQAVQVGLIGADVEGARSFEELYALVHNRIAGIAGIGPLFVYDTALRLGAGRLTPTLVYLHAGTLQGARMLLPGPLPRAIPVEHFPGPLRKCSPAEVEDILCIFRDALGRLRIPSTKKRVTPRHRR